MASLAPGTMAVSDMQYRKFVYFREKEGLEQAWPVPVLHMQKFFVTLKIKSLSEDYENLPECFSFQSRALEPTQWILGSGKC